MVDTLITPLGKVVKRLPYERQNKFKSRVNHEFREEVKSMYVPDWSTQGINTALIVHFPILDMWGNMILDSHIKPDLSTLHWKYINLKVRFEE
jgi:hypothetical protein